MPWCPKCKVEYREGFSICSDCGTYLVDKLPPEENEINNDYIDYDENIKFTFLISVENRIKSSIIQNFLADANILSFIKDKEAGTYLNVYIGESIYGVDIFVDENNYEKAKELIDAYFFQSKNNTYEPLTQKDNRSYYIRKNVMKAIILLCILFPFIIFFIVNTFFSFL